MPADAGAGGSGADRGAAVAALAGDRCSASCRAEEGGEKDPHRAAAPAAGRSPAAATGRGEPGRPASPLSPARAASPGDEVVLQIILSPGLHETARSALLARFGAISDEEMGRRAAESGYELTCFAEPAGALRCQ